MEAAVARREGAVAGFFWVIVAALVLATGYGLLTGKARRGSGAPAEGGPAALAARATELEGALRAKPDDPATLVALGDTYLDLGRNQEALPIFEKAERLVPGNVHILTDLGSLYQQAGALDRALDKFGQVVALDPSQTGALAHLGMLYAQKGDRGKAIESFQAVLQRNPDPRLAETVRREMVKLGGQ